MKLALQYISNSAGKTKAVQMSISEWEKILLKIKKYEQTLKLKSDLKEAFDEVRLMKKSKVKKQTLSDFLNEL